MQLIGHAAVGITLARAVGATHPVAALGVGWLSHYLADFFPHGDEDVGTWLKKGNEVKRLALIVLFDGLAAVAMFAWFAASNDLTPAAMVAPALAAIGSFIPDIMWGLEKLVGRRLFGRFEKLHARNHNALKIHLPIRYGMPLQLAVAALLWWVLIG